MEFIISISRSGKSWNFTEDSLKVKKTRILKRQQTSQKQALISVEVKTSTYFMHFVMLENMLLNGCFDAVRT